MSQISQKNQPTSLTHKAIHAFKWSVLGEIASRTVGPLVFLVLARLLVPEDFGVVAAAMVIISFSQVFSDAGLSKALIQRQHRVEESANIVFWLNIGIGFVIVAILLTVAPLIAGFFHDERITPVVRVLSLQILLSAFSSVQMALLQKDLNFKQLFWVRLATTGAPGLASIPLAIYGMGYWALVAGTIVGQVVQSAVFWMLCPWRPQWGLDRGLTWELVAFSKWAMLSALLGWFYGWMDAIIVGHFLGSHDMGLYRTGQTFVTMIFGLFFSPLLPVLYSAFSRVHDLYKVSQSLLIVVKGIAIVAFPIAAGLITLRVPIEKLVFGDEWGGVGMVIAILALVQGLAWLVGANGEAYRGVGKPHIETWAMALSLIAYFIGYVVSVQYGLVVFLLSRLALVSIGLFSQFVIARIVFSIRVVYFVTAGYKPLIISLLMVSFIQFFETPSEDGVFFIIFKAVIGLLLYAGLIVIVERDYIAQLKNIVRNKSTTPPQATGDNTPSDSTISIQKCY
jgi:PST family polysaccharide transporter